MKKLASHLPCRKVPLYVVGCFSLVAKPYHFKGLD